MTNEGPRNHTERVILAARSGSNAWTSATLARWGVAWPPPTGWRADLIRRDALADRPVEPGLPARLKRDVERDRLARRAAERRGPVEFDAGSTA